MKRKVLSKLFCKLKLVITRSDKINPKFVYHVYRFSKRDREARDAENSAQKLQKENNDLQARTSDAEAARKALDTEVNVCNKNISPND